MEFALGLMAFLSCILVLLFLLYAIFYVAFGTLEKFKELKDYCLDYFQDED